MKEDARVADLPGMRVCRTCDDIKPVDQFAKAKTCIGGRSRRCLECERRVHASYASTPVGQESRAKSYAKQEVDFDAAVRTLCSKAKRRAKIHSIVFDLDSSQIAEMWHKQGGTCAISGRPMTFLRAPAHGTGRAGSHKVTIDRIDSSGGYVEGNFRLACDQANCIKMCLSDDELRSWATDISYHLSRNPITLAA